jgi:hypothetical protein
VQRGKKHEKVKALKHFLFLRNHMAMKVEICMKIQSDKPLRWGGAEIGNQSSACEYSGESYLYAYER